MNVVDIDILIEADGWPEEDFLHALAEKTVAEIWNRLGFGDCDTELSIVFTDDASIRVLNAQWRNKDKATNVLSFPAFDVAEGARPGPMLGDIVIARETIEREALAEDKPFAHHLTHMIVHGCLHLVGYDHEEGEDAERMEAREREILHALAIPDPYALTILDNENGKNG